MAVTIRMARFGRKGIPFYRIVVADKESPRDGRYIERLGTMNPLTNPATLELKEDRVRYWVGVGAKPSDTVAKFIDQVLPGFLADLEKGRLAKVRSARAARKKRNKGKKKEAAQAGNKADRKTSRRTAKRARVAAVKAATTTKPVEATT